MINYSLVSLLEEFEFDFKASLISNKTSNSVGFGLRLTIPIFNVRFYVAKRFVYNKDDVGFGKGFQDFEGDSYTPLGKWLGRGWGIAFTMNHPFY